MQLQLTYPRYKNLFVYADKPVVYLAHVDAVRPIYKYGITQDIYGRIESHRKTFPVFDLEHVRVSHNRDKVERMFGQECRYLGIRHGGMFDGRFQRELLCLHDEGDLPKIKALIDEIIEYVEITDHVGKTDDANHARPIRVGMKTPLRFINAHNAP